MQMRHRADAQTPPAPASDAADATPATASVTMETDAGSTLPAAEAEAKSEIREEPKVWDGGFILRLLYGRDGSG